MKARGNRDTVVNELCFRLEKKDFGANGMESLTVNPKNEVSVPRL